MDPRNPIESQQSPSFKTMAMITASITVAICVVWLWFGSSLGFMSGGAALIPLFLMVGAILMVFLRQTIHANQQMHATNQQIKDIFNAAPDAMLIVSKNGIVTSVNQQALNLFGYSYEEFIGLSVEQLIPERFRGRHRGMRERGTLNAEQRPLRHGMEFYALTKDGNEVPVEIGLNYSIRGGEHQAIATIRDVTERKNTEVALRRSEEVLIKAQQIAHFGSWEWDIRNNALAWSDEIYRIFGLQPKEFEPSYDAFLDRIHPDDREAVVNAVNTTVTYDKPYRIEHRIVRTDGEERIVQERGEVFRNKQGDAVHMVGTVHDITEQKRLEKELKLADNVFNHTLEAILVTDANNRILRINQAFTHITGYSDAEVIGKNPSEILQSGRHDRFFYKRLWRSLIDTGAWEGVIWDRRKSGEIFPSRHNISVVKDERGNIIQYTSIFSDITEQKQAEEHIQNLAQYDQLTKLPNRILFNDRLVQAFHRAKRANNKVGVMFVDLDRFKSINDSLGHQAGDSLLQEVARRLTNCVRLQDTVARLGGDEFTIVLEDLKQAEDASVVANKVLDALSTTMEIEGHDIVSGASIGISIYPDDGEQAESILKNADMAMYQAKQHGRNRYQFYTEEFSINATKRFYMEKRLRQALMQNELTVYYQPQVNMDINELIGAEALVRWNDPHKGLVPPGEFIPLAEETGLIEPIGIWVLETACKQAMKWQQQGFAPFRMTVNVSGYQFTHGSIVDAVKNVLDETKLSPEYLELEITESFFMGYAEKSMATLDALRDLGVSIAIDDFGTGYSSLSYLKRLSIDRLKIDRSFVMDIPHDKDDAAIVSTIIAMAKNLGLSVIAEGVENQGHITFLNREGCDEMQGYFFSKPVPKEEFEKLFLLSSFKLNSNIA